MDWQHIQAGFADELDKIAEVSLRGLSPETVLQASAPPPMDSPGFQKARSILEIAAGMQQPGLEKTSYTYYQPQQRNRRDPDLKPDKIDKAKNFGLHVLSGGGAGRFASEFTPAGASPKRRFIGTAIGAGLGAAEYGRKQYRLGKARKEMTKSSGVLSPGTALRATQQVGKIKNVIHTGPGIKHQISGSLIGRSPP